eukprot:g2770.t1
MKLRKFLKELNDDSAEKQAAVLKQFFELSKPRKLNAANVSSPEVESSASDKKDILTKYVESSPECKELFVLLSNLSRGNTSELCIALHQVFTVILWRADEHRRVAALATKQLLRDHVKRLFANMECHSPRLIKATLQLLGAIAGQGPLQARQLLQRWNFEYKPFVALAQKPAPKGSRRGKKGKKNEQGHRTLPYGGIDMSVRTAYVRLMIAMLRSGATDVTRATIRAKGFVDGAIKNISTDPDSLVSELLLCLRQCAIDPGSRALGRRTLRELFSPSRIGFVLRLCGKSEAKRLIARKLLLSLLSPPSLSIFYNQAEMVAEAIDIDVACNEKNTRKDEVKHLSKDDNRNRGDDRNAKVYSHILRILLQMRPRKDQVHMELLMKVFEHEPLLVAPYMQRISFSCDPRLSDVWISNTNLCIRLLNAPVALPPLKFYRSVDRTTNVEQEQKNREVHYMFDSITVSMIDAVIPGPLTRVALSHGVQHVDRKVKITSLDLIVAVLIRASHVTECFSKMYGRNLGTDAMQAMKRQFDAKLIERLPKAQTLVNLLQPALKIGSKDDESFSLFEHVLCALRHFCELLPSATEELRLDWRRLIYANDKKTRKAGNAGNQLLRLEDKPSVLAELLRLLTVVGPERCRLMDLSKLSKPQTGQDLQDKGSGAITALLFLIVQNIREKQTQQMSETNEEDAANCLNENATIANDVQSLSRKLVIDALYETGLFGEDEAGEQSERGKEGLQFCKEINIWLTELTPDTVSFAVGLIRSIASDPLCWMRVLSATNGETKLFQLSPLMGAAIGASMEKLDLQLQLEDKLCNTMRQNTDYNRSERSQERPYLTVAEVCYISRCLRRLILCQTSLHSSHDICDAVACTLTSKCNSDRLTPIFDVLNMANTSLGWKTEKTKQRNQSGKLSSLNPNGMKSSELISLLLADLFGAISEDENAMRDAIGNIRSSNVVRTCRQITLHLFAYLQEYSNGNAEKINLCFEYLQLIFENEKVDKKTLAVAVADVLKMLKNCDSIWNCFSFCNVKVSDSLAAKLRENVQILTQVMSKTCTVDATRAIVYPFARSVATLPLYELIKKGGNSFTGALSLLKEWCIYLSPAERARTINAMIQLLFLEDVRQHMNVLLEVIGIFFSLPWTFAVDANIGERLLMLSNASSGLTMEQKTSIENLVFYLLDGEKDGTGANFCKTSTFDAIPASTFEDSREKDGRGNNEKGINVGRCKSDLASAISMSTFENCLRSGNETRIRIASMILEKSVSHFELFEGLLRDENFHACLKSGLLFPVANTFLQRALLRQAALRQKKERDPVLSAARMESGISFIVSCFGPILEKSLNASSDMQQSASNFVGILLDLRGLSLSHHSSKNDIDILLFQVLKSLLTVPAPWTPVQLSTSTKLLQEVTRRKMTMGHSERGEENNRDNFDFFPTKLSLACSDVSVRLLEELATSFRKERQLNEVNEEETFLVALLDQFIPKELPATCIDIVQKCIRRALKKRFGSHTAFRLVARLVRAGSPHKSEEFNAPVVLATLASHPKFQSTLVSNASDKVLEPQLALIELLNDLHQLDPTCCNAQLLPLLLMAYNASLTRKDRFLFQLFRVYDNAGIALSSLGFVWGPALVSRRQKATAEKQSKRGGKVPSINHSYEWFYNDVDEKRIENSIEYYPFGRSLDSDITTLENDKKFWEDEKMEIEEGKSDMKELPAAQNDKHDRIDENILSGILDPAFMLPMMLHLFQESELQVRKFIDIGALGYTVMAMSSSSANIRQAAYELVGRFFTLLETAEFRERPQMKVLMQAFKGGIPAPFARLPAVMCAFVAEASRVLLQPGHFMYTNLNSFLLARPELDCTDVPMFYQTFNSGKTAEKEKKWILRLISRGIHTFLDVDLLSRRHVFPVIMDYASSRVASSSGRACALEVLKRGCSLPYSARLLVKRDAILPWLTSNSDSVINNGAIVSIGQSLLRHIDEPYLHEELGLVARKILSSTKTRDESLVELIHSISLSLPPVEAEKLLTFSGESSKLFFVLIKTQILECENQRTSLENIARFVCRKLLEIGKKKKRNKEEGELVVSGLAWLLKMMLTTGAKIFDCKIFAQLFQNGSLLRQDSRCGCLGLFYLNSIICLLLESRSSELTRLLNQLPHPLDILRADMDTNCKKRRKRVKKVLVSAKCTRAAFFLLNDGIEIELRRLMGMNSLQDSRSQKRKREGKDGRKGEGKKKKKEKKRKEKKRKKN